MRWITPYKQTVIIEAKAMDTVFVFSNQPEVELFQNGKSLGRKSVDPNEYRTVYNVDYKKGKLEAIAYNGKKKVAMYTLQTAGNPVKLGISNCRDHAKYSPEELLFFTVEVQDKKGVCCPNSNHEVAVSVEGGVLIGMDSGDPFSHELFKQNKRKVYEEKLLLTVRPSGGELKVKCVSKGLNSGEIELSIQSLRD